MDRRPPGNNTRFGVTSGRSVNHPEQVNECVGEDALVYRAFSDGVTAAYSVRNACIGSSREARHAGKTQAAPATNSSTRLTRPNTVGSSGRVP